MSRIIALLFHDVWVYERRESGFRGPEADRYKLNIRDFEAQLAGVAAIRKDKPVLLAGSALPKRRKVPFAITVDDGGLSYYTAVADRLEERGWRGHCFVTTGSIGTRGFLDRGQLLELHERGHVIGTHSVSHPERFHQCSWEKILGEWRRSRQILEDIIGARVLTGSVPGGCYTPRVAKAAMEAGLRVLFSSEPRTGIEETAGCTVIGRFTLRQNSPPHFAGDLARLRTVALMRESLSWNAKKVAKALLGDQYRRVSRRLAGNHF